MANVRTSTLVIAAVASLSAGPVFAQSADSGAQQGQPPASTPSTPAKISRNTMAPSHGAKHSMKAKGGMQTRTGGPSGGVPGRS